MSYYNSINVDYKV